LINSKTEVMPKGSVAVIGLGYVGLPLCLEFARANFQVVGIDLDEEKIEELNAGKSYIEDILDRDISVMIKSGKFITSTDHSMIRNSDALVICVPTPLTPDQKPDLSILIQACKDAAPWVKEGCLIVNESTSYPGTLRNVITPIFRDSKSKDDFEFASAPERIDPGNREWRISNTPRVIAGLTKATTERAAQLYENICEETVRVSSPEVAEFSKLLENTFRQVNIALVNEISRIASLAGVDINDVVKASSSKPYGFMSFLPGVGVGGHCIPIDPLYLSWFSHGIGEESRIIELAQRVNEEQPIWITERILRFIGDTPKRLLLVGIGYKKGSGDLRESPSVAVYRKLKESGHSLHWYDSFVSDFEGQKIFTDIKNVDFVILLHEDSGLTVEKMLESRHGVLDCSGSLKEFDNPRIHSIWSLR